MHLIIYAHPNPSSFNHSILQAVVDVGPKDAVVVRDLYQQGFLPSLDWPEFQASLQQHYAQDIAKEQAYIKQAEVITLIYPLWWMGFPAILKGYLDRVLAYGFAYRDENGKSIGLLQGKKVQQFVTLGNSLEKYRHNGYLAALDATLGCGIFDFCGITDTTIHYLGEVGLPSTDYTALLAQVREITSINLQIPTR